MTREDLLRRSASYWTFSAHLANSVRCLSTNACEVEELVRHCGTSSDKGGRRCFFQEVLPRVRLYCNEFAVMRRLKDRRKALALRILSALDQIVVCWVNV